MAMPESTAESFEWFADWADGVTPLYERLSRSTAEDEQLLDIAGQSQEGQPPPNMLFAAVHSLLLDGRTHRLADFYRTCTENPVDPEETDPFPTFREFCLDNEDTIREMVQTRRVQTNAVGRSAVLFPAFKHVTNHAGDEPLALVEIGSSAGLNLYWDRFRYQYEGHETYGNPDSTVHIESEVRGSAEPPFWEREPAVATRVGIDINPLDVTDSLDAQWLRALVVPDQYWRFQRLDAAIDLVRDDPPELVEGDALKRLPAVLDDIPDKYDICVFSTLVLYQFDEESISELRDLLRRESQHRTIHWLSNDPDGETARPAYRHAIVDGGIESHPVAEYKAHGEWVRWLSADHR